MSNITDITVSRVTPYRIFILANGDEIICELKQTEGNRYSVKHPFKLVVVMSEDKTGKLEENLALRKWTTFTEDTLFNIDRQQVVVQHGASLGLEKYYKYVLRKYKEADKTNLVPQNLEREVEELKVEGRTEDSLSEEEIMDESANVYFKSDKKH